MGSNTQQMVIKRSNMQHMWIRLSNLFMRSNMQQIWITLRSLVMNSNMQHMWMQLSSLIFIIQLIHQFVPRNSYYYVALARRFRELTNPHIDISFDEIVRSQNSSRLNRAYTLLEAYLNPTSSKFANRIKGDLPKESKKLIFSMNDYEEILDEFRGIKIWWYLDKEDNSAKHDSERRTLMLKFHRNDRQTIMTDYLDHVLREGETIIQESRRLKLYTNNPNSYGFLSKATLWSYGMFDHPVTFDHLAMDPERKKEIIDDLITFRDGEKYYAKVGKPWKRGYLLHGPPGTGKSSMIASMANLLNYDVYDLELTAVRDNSELRKLLKDTTDNCIIVIEDIDCSLNLTGNRKNQKKKEKAESENEEDESDDDEEDMKSNVTLSGLLNFIDGLWSACGKERIIVFTTNHVEKLDPALIRRGRMDKHIEMSYCCFEGFKILAKNYLDLDSHDLFETIRSLLDKVQITPADVAEHLMPKNKMSGEDCLNGLIKEMKLKEVDDSNSITKNKKSQGDCLNDLIKEFQAKLKEIDPKKDIGKSEAETC